MTNKFTNRGSWEYSAEMDINDRYGTIADRVTEYWAYPPEPTSWERFRAKFPYKRKPLRQPYRMLVFYYSEWVDGKRFGAMTEATAEFVEIAAGGAPAFSNIIDHSLRQTVHTQRYSNE